ncbi:hypothetical protein RJ641_003142 [Dillenia turbinata]|uniref:Uncharacterized protein n=1 Tax=Dillenia turbinata TaxID=194707 RepID=A0AAN8Z947_9MAGN
MLVKYGLIDYLRLSSFVDVNQLVFGLFRHVGDLTFVYEVDLKCNKGDTSLVALPFVRNGKFAHYSAVPTALTLLGVALKHVCSTSFFKQGKTIGKILVKLIRHVNEKRHKKDPNMVITSPLQPRPGALGFALKEWGLNCNGVRSPEDPRDVSS